MAKKKLKKIIDKESEKTSLLKKEKDSFKRTKIRIIGIGGGGGSIVSEIASRIKPSQRVSFVAANTDRQALRTVHRGILRVQFGEKLATPGTSA